MRHEEPCLAITGPVDRIGARQARRVAMTRDAGSAGSAALSRLPIRADGRVSDVRPRTYGLEDNLPDLGGGRDGRCARLGARYSTGPMRAMARSSVGGSVGVAFRRPGRCRTVRWGGPARVVHATVEALSRRGLSTGSGVSCGALLDSAIDSPRITWNRFGLLLVGGVSGAGGECSSNHVDRNLALYLVRDMAAGDASQWGEPLSVGPETSTLSLLVSSSVGRGPRPSGACSIA